MGKTEITWIGLIKLKLNELKKQGKSPSIGDVTPYAKKEWVQIKEGNHPKYIQGKAKTVRRKSKGSKGSLSKSNKKMTKSKSSLSSASCDDPKVIIENFLSKCKLCAKCKKSVQKAMKKDGMSGGHGGVASNAGAVTGGSECTTCGGAGGQSGGCGCAVI